MSKNQAINPIWNIASKLNSLNDQDLPNLIMHNRGLNNNSIKIFLNPDYQSHLADPLLLSGTKIAAKRIHQAIIKKQQIVIYGDYDIDGITASAVLYDVLINAGAMVDIYIPDRFEEGYGLHADALQTIKNNGADLVITVDCGVTAIKEAEFAKSINLDLIITDHHSLSDNLPTTALAIINPRLPQSKYPEKELAGVGVAFTLVRAIQKLYPAILESGQEKWLLDLVALGTICDIVPLTGENRVLASYGLKVMRKTKRLGIQALARASATDLSDVDEGDLGFRFGPRLNAAGRLEHARAAQSLLISDDMSEANQIAEKLNQLNSERRLQTQEIQNEAEKQAKKQKENLILVLHDENWNSGVVGIVASYISEKYHKPTIILQTKDNIAKGSARSIGNFSIIDAIRDSADLLEKYGGHSFAAGITLSAENIALFTHRINKYAKKVIDIENWLPFLDIDLFIESYTPNLDDLSKLESLQPFGNSNPQPLLASELVLTMLKPVGQQLNHLKLIFTTASGSKIDGIAFFSAHKWPNLKIGETYQVAYYLQKNTWQDITKAQLEVQDIKPKNK